MPRAVIHRLLASLVLVLLTTQASAPVKSARAQAPADAARFAEIMAVRDTFTPVDSPRAGELVQREGGPSLAARTTETFLENFVATATFHYPEDLGLFDIFDMGFAFRSGDRFVWDSLGFWFYRQEGVGVVVDGLVPEHIETIDENRSVTIDLVVEGDRAMFGVGGDFVAAFDVAPGSESFVAVDSGFIPEFRSPGRVVPYSNFVVWPLPVADVAQDVTPEVAATATAEGANTQPDTSSSSPITPESSERFAALLAEQQNVPPLAGPFNALLKEGEDASDLSTAGVEVADFHASAVVTVPDDAEQSTPWCTGFAFGSGTEERVQVTMSSLADWSATVGEDQTLASGALDRQAAGEMTTLDLMVQGQTAWLGVNGDLVAVIDLPTGRSPGDVALGAGLCQDQLRAGRITPFQDFTVRTLPPGALAPAEASGPTATDEERFLTLLSETDAVTPAAGPFSGRLVESTPGNVATAVAGVAFFDFAATTTVVNPADPALGPWDSGFQFRIDGETASRVMVDSLGDVYAARGGQAPVLVTRAASYDDGPNTTNTLQLFVEGERALFGINGVLAAAIDVPAATAASDVQLGVAFFTEDFVQGRVTDYHDFRVWEIA